LRTTAISDGVDSTTTKFIESAHGAILRDVEGRRYIDFAGGIGVMNIGHCHPKVVAAIKEQAEKFTHTCFMVNPYESAVAVVVGEPVQGEGGFIAPPQEWGTGINI